MLGSPAVRCILVACVAVGITGLVCGCGGGGGGSTGELRVALTDQTADYAQVVVSIVEVLAVPAGQENAPSDAAGLEPIVTFEPALSVDVLTLQYTQQVLGTATVPAGQYNQIRLVLAPNPAPPADPVNYIVLSGDPAETKHPLTSPSGQQSGLKLVGHYDVQPGVLNNVVLDFAPETAVVESGSSGKYIIKPTGIRITQVAELGDGFGWLSGVVVEAPVTDPAVPVVDATVSVRDSTGSLVARGVVAKDEANPDSPINGTFRAYVLPGDYEVEVAAEGYEPYGEEPPVLHTVIAADETDVGQIPLTPVAAP